MTKASQSYKPSTLIVVAILVVVIGLVVWVSNRKPEKIEINDANNQIDNDVIDKTVKLTDDELELKKSELVEENTIQPINNPLDIEQKKQELNKSNLQNTLDEQAMEQKRKEVFGY